MRVARFTWPFLLSLVTLLAISSTAFAAEKKIVLHGAVHFADDHAFNRALLKFEELVKKHYGKPIDFVLHRSGELGTEKDYFNYMSRGFSVDYAIVTPSNMSTLCPSAPLMDMPFLFRDIDHWRKVLEADALSPIASDIKSRADVMVLGYAGGGVRNIIARKPVRTPADFNKLVLRVVGSPIQADIFNALGARPSPIAFNEIYNAIQTGVIDACENESASLMQMKFYEVAPEISLTRHAITVRPLCFSGKTFNRLPKDLQQAVLKAGKEAATHGRQIESSEDQKRLDELAAAKKIRLHEFTGHDELLKKAAPIKAAYAKKIGAEEVLKKVDAIPGGPASE